MNKSICAKCGTDLRTDLGVIKVISPVFDGKRFINYTFCRVCFIISDDLRADEIFKWLKEGSE